MTNILRSTWERPWRHPYGRYACAILLSVAAAGLRAVAQPWTGSGLPFIFFFPAVVLSGLLGGLGPGIACLVSSALLSSFPRASSPAGDATIGLPLFLAACALLLYTTNSARRARSSLEARDIDSRLLAAIVSSSDDAIISKDLTGRITSWNAAAARLFGYSEAEAVGQPITLLIPEDRRDDFVRILDQIRQGHRLQHFETQRRRRDGRILDVSLTVSPIRDESGRIVGASKICRDISAAKAEEAELRRTRELFLGMLGHDLRNPLNTIVASLYQLEKQSPESAQPALARISRASDRMARMIGQLLDFTRARLGAGIPLKPAPADLAQICSGVMEDMEARHPGRTRFSSSGPIEGCWDGDRVAQVLSNLLANAFTHGSPTAPVEVGLSASDGVAILEVRNQGAAIPQEQLSRIFEPFHRAGADGSADGLGLGLYIIWAIVQSHGGTVDVSSGETGTKFTVRLPRNPGIGTTDRRRGHDSGTAVVRR